MGSPVAHTFYAQLGWHSYVENLDQCITREVMHSVNLVKYRFL